MSSQLKYAVTFIAFHWALPAIANDLTLKTGFYRNNNNVERQRNEVALAVVGKAPAGDCESWGLSSNAAQSRYSDKSAVSDPTAKETYNSGTRSEKTLSVGYTATCGRLTDFRLNQSWTTDSVLRSRTTGMGLSRWIWHETIQFSLDLGRTFVDRPVYRYLDVDSEEISPPTEYNSANTTFGMKHLATPTTVTNYTLATIWSNDRPPMRIYRFGLRQFFTSLNGAVHGDLSRIYNRGRVTPDSSFGEVDAWIAELAYLQAFNKTTFARLGWRQYIESETTRANKDIFLMGSDMVSVSVDRKFGQAMSLSLALARYETNIIDDEQTKIVASTVESAVTARF